METQTAADGAAAAGAQGAEPFQPQRAVAVAAQVVAQRGTHGVLLVDVPGTGQLGTADVVFDVRVVVLDGVFFDALPEFGGQQEAVVFSNPAMTEARFQLRDSGRL